MTNFDTPRAAKNKRIDEERRASELESTALPIRDLEAILFALN
jgi:hypothetical protein